MNRLEEIIAHKRSEIAKMHAEEFRLRVERRADFRGFQAAIRRRGGRVRVIAEAKSASPSDGMIVVNYDTMVTVMRYEKNGEDCRTVETVHYYLGGRTVH